MSCREFQEIMYAFIEGNLSEARKRQIESHLKTCASCRHDLAEKKALLSMETQLGEIEPPAYLVSRIMARVRNVPQPRSTWYKLFRLSIPIRIPAVAMVVVVITGLSYFGYVGLKPGRGRPTAIPDYITMEAVNLKSLKLNSGFMNDILLTEDQLLNSRVFGRSIRARCFAIGRCYAESLVLLRTHQNGFVVDRLAAIEKVLHELQAPKPLNIVINRIQDRIDNRRYDDVTLIDLLSMVEPIAEAFMASLGEDYLPFYKLGTWTVDVDLAATSGDADRFKADLIKGRALLETLQPMALPEGLLTVMEKTLSLLEKGQPSDEDTRTIIEQNRRIQAILTHDH